MVISPNPASTAKAHPARKRHTPRGAAIKIAVLVGLLLIPFLEVWTLAQVSDRIGGWQTIGLVLTTSAVGIVLLITQGARNWRSLIAALTEGRTPSRELLDGVLILLGGLAFLIPGLITDLIGLILLLPPTRAVVRRVVGGQLANRVTQRRESSDIIPGTAEETSQDAVVVGRLLP